MLQDIAPKQLDCAFKKECPQINDFLLYSEDKFFLMKTSEYGYEFPTFEDTVVTSLLGVELYENRGERLEKLCQQYGVFRTIAVDNTAFFAVDSKEIFRKDVTLEMVHKSKLKHYEPAYIYFGIVTADQIKRWYNKHKYCGKCGNQTSFSGTERAIVCKKCGEINYPQICPAVTISIVHDGKILLARNRNGTFRKYGQIAGYVEVGETFEDTVRREAFEETGLHVTNIKYYKNQPWALTDAHMIGYTAEVDGSAEVNLQEEELWDARWFAANEIPEDIADVSLTYEMIGNFRKKYLKESDCDNSQQYRESFEIKKKHS